MRITKLTKRSKRLNHRTMELEDAVEMMRGEEARKLVERARRRSAKANPGLQFLEARSLPQLVFGGEFRMNKKGIYSGLVVLEINCLTKREDVAAVKHSLKIFPQTLVAMENALGNGVVVVVRYSRPDGSLPEEGEMAEIFHAHAYRHALKTYEPELGIAIELRRPSVMQSVALSYDPEIYYNPSAVTVLMDQPSQMPQESVYQENFNKLETIVETDGSRFEQYRYMSLQFEMAYKAALEKCEDFDGMDFKPLLVHTARLCFGAGIQEEETVRWCLLYFGLYLSEVEVRTTVGNVFLTGRGFGEIPLVNETQLGQLREEEFMKRRYVFRCNMMSGVTEYRERHSFNFEFRPVTKKVINSIVLNARREGIKMNDHDVKYHVYSDRVPDYLPIEDYLNRLPKWDGKDRIRPLLKRVPTDNEMWVELGYRWILSMVAHWQDRDRDHGNALSPLLIGSQGCGKSTYAMNILPPELRQYYNDGLDLSQRRDSIRALARYALINLDEFDQVSERYQALLKYLQQTANINDRAPRATNAEKLKRYATFIATSNHTDLLTDPSGSRRFICVKITADIDNGQPIEYEQLYAQILALLDAGERYWLTREEEQKLMGENLAFQKESLAESLFKTYYRPAAQGEQCMMMRSGEILRSIQEKSGMELPKKESYHFGRFLTNYVGRKIQDRSGAKYCIVEL